MAHREIPIMLEDMHAEQRQSFCREMSDEYRNMQRDAVERSREAKKVRNVTEETAWDNMATYCGMMADLALRGIFDEPDTHLSFYSFDERIGDKKLLLEVMQDRETGKQTTWTQAHLAVVGAALQRLTPKQREIAELYYMGSVKRKNLPDMLKMPLSTVDTHIRDINREWRTFTGEVESGEPVQASWLAHLHEVTDTPMQG